MHVCAPLNLMCDHHYLCLFTPILCLPIDCGNLMGTEGGHLSWNYLMCLIRPGVKRHLIVWKNAYPWIVSSPPLPPGFGICLTLLRYIHLLPQTYRSVPRRNRARQLRERSAFSLICPSDNSAFFASKPTSRTLAYCVRIRRTDKFRFGKELVLGQLNINM